ncbi:MAG: L-2-amino-thiazoline-4-carboxylic acid hydrolase [Candidatus Helarchaeota archaeon]|nr:L-2-amino-thiazoline-4-carboxylic acid hydrolase [Candidatus Helarchaeota archaeon]
MVEKSTDSKKPNKTILKKRIKEKYDISLNTQKFILQMCWAQHDAQWFLKSKNEFGIKEANEMNKKVVYSMGKIEARHILNALNIQSGTIKTISELFKICNTFMEVIIPKIMKFKFIAHSQNEGVGIVKKCFIWEQVKQSKKESEYECSCNFRHRGWLNAMGVDGKIIPVKRISDGDEFCEFKFLMND